MLLLKEKQSKQIFCLDTTIGKFQVAHNKTKNKDGKIIEIHFKLLDILQSMVDYELNQNQVLRITKIHYITIVDGRYLSGTCNYEILEKE